jgi:hypothetical protein
LITTQSKLAPPRRGRPRKFAVPSRALTLTLPDSVIAALERIDRDVSRAVVRLVQPELKKAPRAPAELATFGRHAVIVVTPTRTLERRTGVLLVPLSDGRALIAFDEPMTTAKLALQIQDELDEHRLPDDDMRVFEAIRDVLKNARRSHTVALRQMHIIVLDYVDSNGRKEARLGAGGRKGSLNGGKV